MGGPEGERRHLDRIRSAYSSYTATGRDERWDLSSPGNLVMHEERLKAMDAMVRHGLLPSTGKLLDVGCGSGGSLSQWVTLGFAEDDIYGIDLLPERILRATPCLRSGMVCGSAHELPFEDQTFDVVGAFTLLSSVSDVEMAGATASEMARVLRPGGRIVCYDMRLPSPMNPHVRPVSLRQLRSLFPQARMESRTLTVLPPLTRFVARIPGSRSLPSSRFLHSHRLTVISF